jgi:hypothetical protein
MIRQRQITEACCGGVDIDETLLATPFSGMAGDRKETIHQQ